METKEECKESIEVKICPGDKLGMQLAAGSMLDMKSKLEGPKTEADVPIERVMKDIGDDLQAACLQWLQPMTENEQFELLSPTQVENLLEEAKALEESLLQEKEQLLSRLQMLSRSLQLTT